MNQTFPTGLWIISLSNGKPYSLSLVRSLGRFIDKLSHSERVIGEQEGVICKYNDRGIYCETIKTSSLGPTELTFVWSPSQMEMALADSWQRGFWDDTKCVWELAKKKKKEYPQIWKKDLRVGFSLPGFFFFFFPTMMGWENGLGPLGIGEEAPERKVTWRVPVKVSCGQAWGEQWGSVVVCCLQDLDILPMSV